MSEGSAWQGNWLVRLRERIRERGYDSVTAFAEARPTTSWPTWPMSSGRTSPGADLQGAGRRSGAESQDDALGAGNARARAFGVPP